MSAPPSARQTARTFSSPAELGADLVAVARAVVPLLRGYRELDPALRERVMVAVSRANACGGCTQVHERWALRAGVSDNELRAIGLEELAALDAASRAAVVYASERAQRRFRAPARREVAVAADAALSPSELAQIDAVARAMALANLTVSTFGRLFARAGRAP